MLPHQCSSPCLNSPARRASRSAADAPPARQEMPSVADAAQKSIKGGKIQTITASKAHYLLLPEWIPAKRPSPKPTRKSTAETTATTICKASARFTTA
jgi:hypothetical protein